MTAARPDVDGSPAPLPVAGAREVAAHVRLLLRGRARALVFVVAVLFAGGLAGVVTPTALGRIVDVVHDGGSASRIWVLAAAMGIGVVAEAALVAYGFVLSARLFETVVARLREQMIDVGLSLPLARVEAAGSGDLVSRASDDVAQVSTAINQAMPALTGSLFAVLATFVGLGALDWRFMVAMLVVVPVHVATLRWYRRVAPAIYEAERAAMASRAQQVLESVRGIDSVHAYGLAGRHNAVIARRSWSVVRWTMQARIVQNRFFGRVNFAEFLGMATLLVVGFWLVRAGSVSVGATTAAMLLFHRVFNPVSQLLMSADTLQSGLTSLQRIVGVIVEAPAGASTGNLRTHTLPGGRPAGNLRIEGVTHAYTDGHPVLHDVSLTVPAGQTVALVGASGAGKTTLASLVAGVRPLQAGRVTLDGVDVTAWPAEDRARHIALVTQDVHVFAGPLRDDLRLAVPDAGDEALLAALDAVGASVWVGGLPDGLDTVVGAHGHRLTPVQEQQIALARLVLLDPAVVLLDEATAEAGSAGAEVLEAAASASLRGRSGLVVAHRLNQAARADRVLVMADGRIVEDGGHEELAAAGGVYARLWAAWSTGR